MIKVRERFPNFVDPGDDHQYWEGEFETIMQVFFCELVQRWKGKLGDTFSRIAINAYPDPSGVWVDDGAYMLTVYDREDTVYNIAWVR